MVCGMPEPCKFPSLDSCQKRFLWTHKEADLAPHPVVGLVLEEGDAEKFPQALGLESLDLLLRVSTQGLCFTATAEDEGDRRLVQLELACEAGGVWVVHIEIASFISGGSISMDGWEHWFSSDAKLLLMALRPFLSHILVTAYAGG